MSNILEDMYTGRMRPFGELSGLSDEYKTVARQLTEVEAEILRCFPDSESLFNQHRELLTQLTDMSVRAEFVVGFRAGAQLMLEMLKPL